MSLADVLSDPERGYPLTESALLLGNCAYLLASGTAVGGDAASDFSRLAGQVASRWPASARVILNPTIRVLLHQPSEIHVHSWAGVTRLRCIAGKASAP